MIHTTLISTDELAAHLDDGWAIVDCRFDLQDESWGRLQYHIRHVPGAIHANLSEDLSGPPSGRNGRHPLPAVADMAATFGRFGIGPNTQVVAYDQSSGMYASRLWWMLRYAGHDAVAVLDGGWDKWVREGRPTRDGDESRAAVSFVAAPREEMCVDVETVIAIRSEPTVKLVDARAPERFEGRSETLDRVAGHIPGAVNHFFKHNLADDGTMLPADTLRANFTAALEGHAADQTVMYCGSGVTACQNLLAMEHAGLRGARLYAGSWSEWSSDPKRAIETGPSK